MEQLTTGYKLLEERVDTVMTDCEKEREVRLYITCNTATLINPISVYCPMHIFNLLVIKEKFNLQVSFLNFYLLLTAVHL